MKKLLVTLLAVTVAPAIFAQGSFVAANTADGVNPGPQGVVQLDGGPLLATPAYTIEAYWGPIGTLENALTLIGSSAILGNGLFYIGQIDTQPGTTSGAAQVAIQFRGFLTANPLLASGRSIIVSQDVAYSTTFPFDMVNTGNWSINIVPEPSTIALAGLGAVALLAIRRRK